MVKTRVIGKAFANDRDGQSNLAGHHSTRFRHKPPFTCVVGRTFRRGYAREGHPIVKDECSFIGHRGRSAVDFATPVHRFRPAIRRLQGRSSAIDFGERVPLLRLVRRLPCLPPRERATTHAAGVGQALTRAAIVAQAITSTLASSPVQIKRPAYRLEISLIPALKTFPQCLN